MTFTENVKQGFTSKRCKCTYTKLPAFVNGTRFDLTWGPKRLNWLYHVEWKKKQITADLRRALAMRTVGNFLSRRMFPPAVVCCMSSHFKQVFYPYMQVISYSAKVLAYARTTCIWRLLNGFTALSYHVLSPSFGATFPCSRELGS